jgi:hypothetical protein
MPRWLLALPLVALVLAGGAFALLLGGRAATTTETEVIERVADLYLAQGSAEAARTDCAARPAQSPELWLVVICARASGEGRQYFIDRFGRVVDEGALDAAL